MWAKVPFPSQSHSNLHFLNQLNCLAKQVWQAIMPSSAKQNSFDLKSFNANHLAPVGVGKTALAIEYTKKVAAMPATTQRPLILFLFVLASWRSSSLARLVPLLFVLFWGGGIGLRSHFSAFWYWDGWAEFFFWCAGGMGIVQVFG